MAFLTASLKASLATAAVVAALFATAADAATAPCGDHDTLHAQLGQTYSEVPVAMGLDSQGRMLEILAAPSGTWTILVTTAGGLTCLVASGTAFETAMPELAGAAS